VKPIRWIRQRLAHKFEHFRLSHLVDTLKEHGPALIAIIVVWEIIEDVCFPLLFIWLGTHVHSIFLIGAPASWLLCLHWLVVPLTWNFWVKFKTRTKDK